VGRAALIGLLAVLLLPSCGGESVDPEEYRSEMNAVCAAGDQRVEAVGSVSKIDDAEEAAALRKLAAALEPTVDRLEQLSPPSEERTAHNKMVSAYRVAAAAIGDMADGLEASDRAATAEATSEYTTAVNEAQGLARDLELDECNRFGLPAGN
jgi:hypothetical protein